MADVLDIVQCGWPRGKRQLGARGNTGLVAGAGPELVVWPGSFLLEAGESSLPLPFAAPVGSGLDRELGLTEPGHRVLPHEFCTVQAVYVVVTAAASRISGLQQIEGLTLATKVGKASLRQVPRAIHHMLTIRKANLVHIIQRRSSGGEAIQPVAPAPTGSARLAVLGCIPRPRLWGSVLHEGRWLFFLLFCRELGRGLLFLEGHSFLKERRIPFLFRRELGRGQLLLLEWDGFLRGRGLHFTLSLKVRALLRSVRGIPGESVAQGWGRGCSIAS